VQSFDDDELRWLGRIHGADEAEAAFQAARRAGFANINLDFIFGLPGQRAETWMRTLRRAIALGPQHLSLYSLMVEQGTPLADQVRRGLVAQPDDDLAAELYELACDALARAGYAQYEISNWTIDDRRWTMESIPSIVHDPSSQCHHNLVYWRREPYLGFGAGAHSFEPTASPEREDVRWWNVRPVREYVERITAGRSPQADSERVDRRTAMGEAMMLGLRLVQEGMPAARFREQFGVEIEDVFATELRDLAARGLIERLPDRVRLTPQGRLLGNQVFAAFLP
jgi:oxygen-independent coproporphyrinogen-3 oxidase